MALKHLNLNNIFSILAALTAFFKNAIIYTEVEIYLKNLKKSLFAALFPQP